MGNNFIEINGKRYDTITGKQLDTAPSASHANTPKVTKVTPQQNTGVVDGFSKRKRRSSAQPQHVTKQVQRSNTLMRSSVKKPEQVLPKTKQAAQQQRIQKSQLGASAWREQQAKKVQKSAHVQKYAQGERARTSVVKKAEPTPVKAHPAHPQPQESPAAQPAAHQQSQHHRSAAEKMIEAALANAHSHEEVHQSKKKKKSLAKRFGISARVASVGTATLAVVLLAGFFAIQNVPNLAMRVAATRAGFSAEMPNYQPSGFSFKGPINYSAGKVTVSFRSNIDDRSYDVIQQSSNWNSEALLSNYVVAEGKQYQTYLDRGRTLYIYEGSNATWVDDGIWYQIEGESELTTDQLIRIAASI